MIQRHQEQTRAAIAIMRNRIAGELHDIIGHAVTIIVLHSAAARQQVLDDPAQADQSLAHIEAASKQATRELRSVLPLLRPDGAHPDGSDGGAHEPLNGVADVATLIEVVRLAGLTVDYEQRGLPVRLAQDVDLAAYRLVQEALTNVAKHVGSGHMPGRCSTGESSLVIKVEDTGVLEAGQNSVDLPGGQGLLALRLRVLAVHGEMTVHMDRLRGSRVEAQLPTEASHRLAGC